MNSTVHAPMRCTLMEECHNPLEGKYCHEVTQSPLSFKSEDIIGNGAFGEVSPVTIPWHSYYPNTNRIPQDTGTTVCKEFINLTNIESAS